MTDPMDVVRQFFRAMNRSDADALARFYHPSCVVEGVFVDDGGTLEGRDSVAREWRREFERHPGALAGGHRVDVSRIAGLETGWGWVRADWLLALDGPEGARHVSGYSHFWVDGGLIHRHRSVAREVAPEQPAADHAAESRQYPARPVVGIGAVVLNGAGELVLVRRRYEPLAGQWSLPGGGVELGESLEAAVAREIVEETGLVIDVGPVVEVFDRILVDEHGRVRYHYVLIDYLCRCRAGTLAAGTDVSEAVFVDPARLDEFRVTEKARDVVARALRIEERLP